MNIRAQIYGSSKPEEPLLRDKSPKGAKGDALDSVSVSREESRRGSSRTEDRHRLSDETVRITHDGVSHEAQLVNLSGGGAMVRGALDVKLWDGVELHLGEHGTIECAVRWIRGDRIGLEFAHETRLDCSSDELATVLRDVISRSFPDARFDGDEEEQDEPGPASEDEDALPERRATDRRSADRRVRGSRPNPGDHRRATRHPLIWSGTLHLDNQSTTVRVRNISSTGALIECTESLSPGCEPVLQLNDEAALAATVQWVVGAQVGLSFHRPFDMQLLSRSKPQVAPASNQWLRPDYLETSDQNDDESDPWDPRWKRLTLRQVNEELEGYLKR